MGATWGEADTQSYRRKHIRETRVAGSVAYVHKFLPPVMARVLEKLSELHVDLPEQIVSYDPEGTEKQRLGLALHLSIPSPVPDELPALLEEWKFVGLRLGDTDLVELSFDGTPVEAQEYADRALAVKLDRVEDADVSGPPPIHWPGSRELALGDTGHDVEFLRLVLNVPDRNAPVDDALLSSVGRFLSRRGAPVSDGISFDFWRRLLPLKRPHVSQGDSGLIVRILQAALATYESAETKVTGVWGTLTARDVLTLQREYNLRVAPFIRDPEWAVLLGPVPTHLVALAKSAKGQGVVATAAEISAGNAAQSLADGIRSAAEDMRTAQSRATASS